jgi:hypothetical protein
MKLRQKLVSHFLRLADLYRMGSVAAAVVALVLVFGLTQPINLPRHNAMLEHFSHLQNDESRLGEAVLQLNFSLTNNYDQVTGLIEHMRPLCVNCARVKWRVCCARTKPSCSSLICSSA